MPSIEKVARYYDDLGDDYDKVTNDYMRDRRGRIIREEVVGRYILDIGCNCGDLMKLYLSEQKAVGVDISIKSLKLAENLVAADFVLGDATALPLRNDVFDCAVCSESLYYLDQPELLVREAFDKLKPGGKFIVVFSNQLYHIFGRTIGPILGWTIKDVHNHVFFPKEVINMFENAKFKQITHKGFAAVPFKGMEVFDKFVPSILCFDHLVTGIKES